MAYGKQTIIAPVGGVVRAKSAVGWDRGFTGYITDSETGLLHARARQYSPTLGLFVSRDPMGYYDGETLYGAFFVPGGVDPLGYFNLCVGLWKDGPHLDVSLGTITPTGVDVEHVELGGIQPPFIGPALTELVIHFDIEVIINVTGTIDCRCYCGPRFELPFDEDYPFDLPYSVRLGAKQVYKQAKWAKQLIKLMGGEAIQWGDELIKALVDEDAVKALQAVSDQKARVLLLMAIVPSVMCTSAANK